MSKYFFKSMLSLKNQLIAYFMLVAFIPAAIVSVYYYISSQNKLENGIGESSYKTVSSILGNVESQVQQASQLTDWIYLNKDIVTLLRRNKNEVGVFDNVKSRAIEELESQFQYLPITGFISSLLILSDNGMDIRKGRDVFTINTTDLYEEKWYQEGRSANGQIVWGSAVKNYAVRPYANYVIPLFRCVKDVDTGVVLGSISILFDEEFLRACYKGVSLDTETIYITDSDGKIISSSSSDTFGTNIIDTGLNLELLGNKPQYFETSIQNETSLVVHKKSPKTGWQVIFIIPLSGIQEQRMIILNTSLLLAGIAIFMSSIFSLFLSGNFTRPIKRLVKRVNLIAQGNFEQPSVKLNNKNEIGMLSRSIDKMAGDIQKLISENTRKEEEKRKAEIKMLQSQINPHFLYNTLNSVKMMASLQGANSIKDMVICLGRLLKAILDKDDEKIPLRQELSNLDDYIYIQRVRYKGKVELRKDIKNEDLLDCLVIRFILQPLVENAIFHGIEPMSGTGVIYILVREDEGRLVLTIKDNGVGMSRDKIVSVLDNTQKYNSAGDYKGIGINNVNQRIKLVYGEEYGINISSIECKCTSVSLSLPIEYDNKTRDAEGVNRDDET